MKTVEHADYQRYFVFAFFNILIISVLVVGLQAGFTVKPRPMVNYWHPIHYRIKGLYTCKSPFKFTEQLRTAVAFFDSLNKTNKYAITWRLQTAKKPETREKRMNIPSRQGLSQIYVNPQNLKYELTAI